MSKFVGARFDDQAEQAMFALQHYGGYESASEAVTSAVQCWSMALDLAAFEVAEMFSRPEWCAIADANNGAMWDGIGTRPGMHLACNVEDAGKLEGLGAKWDIDVLALTRRLHGLGYVQGWAVIQAVRWFWQHCHDIDTATDEWWTPAFRKQPASPVRKRREKRERKG